MNTMRTEWVTGYYIGERAKSIIEHANAGIGYFIIQQGRQGNQATCLAAFQRATDSPVPEHLDVVRDARMIAKLDKRHEQRNGERKRQEPQQTILANPDVINNIRDTLKRHRGPIPAEAA